MVNRLALFMAVLVLVLGGSAIQAQQELDLSRPVIEPGVCHYTPVVMYGAVGNCGPGWCQPMLVRYGEGEAYLNWYACEPEVSFLDCRPS